MAKTKVNANPDTKQYVFSTGYEQVTEDTITGLDFAVNSAKDYMNDWGGDIETVTVYELVPVKIIKNEIVVQDI